MELVAGELSFNFFKAKYDAATNRNITTVHVLQGMHGLLRKTFTVLCITLARCLLMWFIGSPSGAHVAYLCDTSLTLQP